MNQFSTAGLLWAQASTQVEEQTVAWYQEPFTAFLIIVATAIACFALAWWYTKSIRMKDHAWRLGLTLTCFVVGAEIIALKWPPKLGVDLKGGVVFIAELAPVAEGESVTPEDLVPRLKERVDPTNTKEIMIRPYGAKMIEIVIPDVDQQEADRTWRTLVQAGFMQFRIVADSSNHPVLFDQAQRDIQSGKLTKVVANAQGEAIGRWVGVGRRYDALGRPGAYRWTPNPGNLVRDPQTGQIVDTAFAPRSADGDNTVFSQWVDKEGHSDLEVLVAIDKFNVTGDQLANPRPGIDERGRPCVNFQLRGRGISDFFQLTSNNTGRPLGIVMDDRLLSAPNINTGISQSGQIMGDFTQAEVDELVNILKSGRLPGTLKKNPVSKDQVDSNIGRQLQSSGLLAIGLSFVTVMVFMAIYYMRAGIIACLVLLINVSLIVSMTMLIKFPFSLTSLAGLVLTVGMSVDANVLIYERIREELAKGTTLRLAIQNGFARAMSTIIDANLTTLLTAVVLYLIGTEHIRGFAVTLILGIVMSLFTAIFCARVMFEIAERQRWLGTLKMMQVFDGRMIDFGKLWPRAAVVSLVCIALGLVGVVVRGSGILSHDLQGGTSARVLLTQATPVEEVRKLLNQRFNGEGSFADKGPVETSGTRHTVEVAEVTVDGVEQQRVYRVDTSLRSFQGEGDPPADYPQFQQVLEEALGDRLARYELSYTAVEVSAVETESSSTTPPTPNLNVPGDTQPASTEPSGEAASEEAASGETPADAGTTGEPGTSSDEPAGSGEPMGAAIGSDSLPVLVQGPLPSDIGLVFTSLVQDDPASTEPAATEPAAAGPQDPETPPATEPAAVDPSETPAQDPPTVEPTEPGQAETGTQTTETPGSDPPVIEPPAIEPPVTEPMEGQAETETQPVGNPTETPGLSPVDEVGATPTRLQCRSTLTFTYPISEDGLRQAIREVAQVSNIAIDAELVKLTPGPEGATPGTVWVVESITAEAAQFEQLLGALQTDLQEQAYFSSLAEVGGQIAEDAQLSAFGALFISLVGIVLYIWVRFQKVAYGLAAVVALVHDVLFVLGAIAVSKWLAPFLGFALIENFKISVPVIAAFLTIIGYSLNDTIVVFDRIRETKGKSTKITLEMINSSISQTLSRTILTSFTTFIVIVILYFIGGEAIHSFAFALMVGIFVGTYSSIFIAAPVLYYLTHKIEKA